MKNYLNIVDSIIESVRSGDLELAESELLRVRRYFSDKERREIPLKNSISRSPHLLGNVSLHVDKAGSFITLSFPIRESTRINESKMYDLSFSGQQALDFYTELGKAVSVIEEDIYTGYRELP